MLPFSRKVPRRAWLGFVDAAPEHSSALGWVISGLGAASVALLLANGGSASASERDQAAPPSSAAAPAPRAPTPNAETAETEPSEPAAEQNPAPVPASPAAGPVATAAEPAPEAAPASAPAEPKVRTRRPPPPPPPLSASAQRRAERNNTRLRAAIRGGEVLRTPGSFAVKAGGADTSWTEAKSHCAQLDVAGVSGWKLPSRSEARELQRGGALLRASGAFWTKQRSSKHDDAIFVYDARTRRSTPWLEEEIAGVVCVQPAPR